MKHRIQGIVLGFLLAVLLLGAVPVVSAATQSISVTYGINVIVNGVRQTFSNDMRPFTSGGRTFLPVRGIAEALGADVSWDAATSTVRINSGTQLPSPGSSTPTSDIFGFNDLEQLLIGNSELERGVPAGFVVRGQEIPISTNALRYHRVNVNRNNNLHHASNRYAIDGRFSRMTVSFAVADNMSDAARLVITADDGGGSFREIGSFVATAGTHAVDVDIPIAGVETLIITVSLTHTSVASPRATTHAILFDAQFYP